MRYREFKAIVDKGSAENYFIDKYLFRHISIFGSYLLSFTRVSPNVITALSLALSLGAVWFFMQTDAVWLLVGCALVFAYHYLDHVDGELARFYYATRGRRTGIAGAYFDVLCHSFTVNLWLPALAFGVYLVTEQPLVMLLGIAAMAAMSSFSALVGTHMYAMQLVKDPGLVRTESGQAALEVLSGRHRQIDAVNAGVFSKAGLAKLAKEIIGYPGMILVIIVCVVIDVLTGGVWARLGVIVVLTAFHGANNVRRAGRIMKQFRQIG